QRDGEEAKGQNASETPQQESTRQAAVPAQEQDAQPAESADDLFGPSQAGADVNTLMVLNTSGKPLYLMPGEIITGGQQDRTIGEEVVIEPGEKPVAID